MGGKGVTYDSGGLNMKPTNFIENMYLDMSGAAIVLASLRAAVELKVPKNIMVCLALAENAVDANSYYPHQILKSHAGMTVEVRNTDAEGRLCLADAMSWAQSKHGPVSNMIEVSTLTGACKVALGEHAAGLFANSDRLATDLYESGAFHREILWRMPYDDAYVEELDSKVCDVRSMGKNNGGGACTAAAFLSKFVHDGVNWAHIDVAGPAMLSEAREYYPENGSGFGV